MCVLSSPPTSDPPVSLLVTGEKCLYSLPYQFSPFSSIFKNPLSNCIQTFILIDYRQSLMATDPITPEMNDNEHSTSNEVLLKDFEGDGIDYSGHFITSKIFETDSEAIDWAKKVAIKIGFELVISSHKNGGKKKLLRCSRGVRYRLRNLDSAVRKNTKTKSCDCKFQIWVQQFQSSSSWKQFQSYNSWRICVSSGTKGTHNHALSNYPEGYRRQNSGLSPASKKIVHDMSLAQVKPGAILASIKEEHPEDNATIRDVYNYRDYLRRVGFEDKDVAGVDGDST